jgi:hypothetical protein
MHLTPSLLLWWKGTCLFYCYICMLLWYYKCRLNLPFFKYSGFCAFLSCIHLYFLETLEETLKWFFSLLDCSLHFPVCGDVHWWWWLWKIQLLVQCLYFSVNQRFEIIVERACKLYFYNIIIYAVYLRAASHLVLY